jgi:hypothetical protein
MKQQSWALWGVLLPALLGALSGCGDDDTKATNGRPGAPARVTAQPADAQATVTWAPPTTDGGSGLLYYLVHCEPRCGGAMVSADRFQVTVRGLDNGSPYVFKVSAVNANGEGPASAPSEAVTPKAGMTTVDPTAPGQPRAVRATPGNGQVYVSWLAPATFGGRELRGYRVTAEPVGTSVTVDAETAGVTFKNLENGQPYTFSVVATNEVGDGPKASSGQVQPYSGPAPSRWVAGYWVGYQRDRLHEDAVDFSGLTHLIVGRFNPGLDALVYPEAEWGLLDERAYDIAKTLSRRAHQEGRKALLMIGGDGARPILALAASDNVRPLFVRSLIEHLDALGYDGIDVDWEPIDLRAGDGEKLLALLDDLRAARPDILLTVPVFGFNTNSGLPVDQAAFARRLVARVDQLNIMSYAQSFESEGWPSWHSSALHSEDPRHPSSVSGFVKQYLDAGVPAGRLGVGIGYFGMCFVSVTEPRATLRPGLGNDIVASDNVMSYANILAHYYTPEARRWDAVASVPYLSLSSPKGPMECTYVTYEDSDSILAKGQYVRQQGLGGAIVWTLNQGHIPSAEPGQRHPLSDALKRGFLDP